MSNEQQPSGSTNDVKCPHSKVERTSGNQSSDEEEKKLLDDLDEIVENLEARLKVLSQSTDQPPAEADKSD